LKVERPLCMITISHQEIESFARVDLLNSKTLDKFKPPYCSLAYKYWAYKFKKNAILPFYQSILSYL